MRLLKALSLTFFSYGLCACAGPTTPFGGHTSWLPKQVFKMQKSIKKQIQTQVVDRFLASAEDGKIEISVEPQRQVLHDRSDIKISIFDPEGIPKGHKIRAYFDGYDVSKLVFPNKIGKIYPGDRQINIEFKNLRIPAGMERDIVFSYQRNDKTTPITYEWKSPECLTSARDNIIDTQKFSPPDSWIRTINQAAANVGINPSLLAGLVAQESSFNPNAVSWAKAIGLTQITPVADREIGHDEWARSTKINRYPSAYIKTLILTGKLTEEDDYRLNPKTSVQAGALYLDYLKAYWDRKTNRALIAKHFKNPEEALTKVILSSYNSGAYRTKKAIIEKGSNFLESQQLKEARKYVSRTSSFCYHFSNKSVAYNE